MFVNLFVFFVVFLAIFEALCVSRENCSRDGTGFPLTWWTSKNCGCRRKEAWLPLESVLCAGLSEGNSLTHDLPRLHRQSCERLDLGIFLSSTSKH